jgi:hypothetical protein
MDVLLPAASMKLHPHLQHTVTVILPLKTGKAIPATGSEDP